MANSQGIANALAGLGGSATANGIANSVATGNNAAANALGVGNAVSGQ